MATVKIETTLARTGFIASDATLATLAREYVAGADRADSVRGSYLRVLVAHSQRELQSVKRPDVDATVAAIAAANAHLYPVILQAITTPDVAPEDGLDEEEKSRRTKERNRRSNFARTAKSVLTSWARAGGKLAVLKPPEVRKDDLQALYARPREAQSVQERIQAARDRLLRLMQELAASDPVAARTEVEEVQQELLTTLPAKPLTRRRMKRGEVTLHPH